MNREEFLSDLQNTRECAGDGGGIANPEKKRPVTAYQTWLTLNNGVSWLVATVYYFQGDNAFVKFCHPANNREIYQLVPTINLKSID